MKKNPAVIISIISCVLIAFCLFQIVSLRNEVSYLQSNTNSNLSHIQNSVSNIYSNVSDMLEEEASILSSENWEYGEIDVENNTVGVIWTIVPKVYDPEITTAAVVCNGQEFPLTYQNGQYVGSVAAPLFEENHFSHVTLSDNGTIRTDNLDYYISPRYEALPNVYAYFGGGYTYDNTKTACTLDMNGMIDINIDSWQDFEVKSIEVIEVLDGKEIGRIPVDISRKGQIAYGEEAAKSGDPVPEYLAEDSISYAPIDNAYFADNAYFFYYLDKKYSIPNGSLLELYVDVVDGHGLRYRSLAECYAVKKDGNPDDVRIEDLQMYIHSEAVAIYDENGDLLYTVDENLFR